MQHGAGGQAVMLKRVGFSFQASTGSPAAACSAAAVCGVV